MATIDEMLVTIDATTEKLRAELARGDQQLASFESNVSTRLSKIDQYFLDFGRSFAELIPVLGAGEIVGGGSLNETRSSVAVGGDPALR